MTLYEYSLMCQMGGVSLPDYSQYDSVSEECLKYSTLHLLKNYRKFKHHFCNVLEAEKFIRERLPLDADSDDKVKKAIQEMALDEILKRHIDNCERLEEINVAIEFLKKIPRFGDLYYKIIQTYYIADSCIQTTETAKDIVNVSPSTFFTYKKQAIDELSFLLWGMPEKQKRALDTLKELQGKTPIAG